LGKGVVDPSKSRKRGQRGKKVSVFKGILRGHAVSGQLYRMLRFIIDKQ